MVRNLQETYYKSENGNVPTLDPSTGIIHHLPLWRVSWTELPGRSNVLNVHEPTYTDMFETILNRPKPWYFGHLYLPGGSQSLRSGEPQYQLRSWRDCDSGSDDADTVMSLEPNCRTAVVGTLMKIVDFRRLEDGRLCLLVHAMERFVVHDAIQNLPYSIAHVQILPDYEQLATLDTLEEHALLERARAVQEAFRYHDYEYKETPLPLSRDKYMSLGDVYGSWLSELLPFAPYHLDTTLLMADPDAVTIMPPAEDLDALTSRGVELSVETRLLNKAIVKGPAFGGNGSRRMERRRQQLALSNDQLEAQLWNALEDYCCAKGIRLPDQVLCLLPQGRSWMRVPDVWYRRVSNSHYPACRRQTRLSFAVAYWLERTGRDKENLRQAWLETPTTKARLIDLIERLALANDEPLLDFQ